MKAGFLFVARCTRQVPCDLHRAGADVLLEQAIEMVRADAQSCRERIDVRAVERAVADQPVGNLASLPPLIAQREFRPADVGTVVALVTAVNRAIFAFAPAIFGWLHDRTASYVAAFVLAAAAQLAAVTIVVAGPRFS